MKSQHIPRPIIEQTPAAHIWWKQEKPSIVTRIEQALPAVCSNYSGQVSEDRASTVGGSDIGSCMRRVVLDKWAGKKEHSFSTLAKFFRGHRQEEFNAPIHRHIAFEDGLFWIPQVRVALRANPRLRAHVDNVYFVSTTGRIEDATHICVVEEKNAKDLPDEPYDAHIEQASYQISLLKDWVPQAEVCGQIYGTDLNGEHTDWDLLLPYDPDKASRLFERGEQILRHLDNGCEPQGEPSHLCGFCSHRDSCAKWAKGHVAPEILKFVQRFKKLSQLSSKVKAEQDVLKEQLVSLFTNQQQAWFRGQLAPDAYLQIQDRLGRETCDIKALKADHPEIASRYIKRGRSYKVITVTEPK
ncbi:hypothetical protein [Geoalkalibacter halelectricus]|uniref:hypothetical protein n=1 Tax=Geoalkalibacter halelectricus TaxID=2847045 RepID=UPI003D22B1DE